MASESLLAKLTECCRLFRVGREAEANSQLAALIEPLLQALPQLAERQRAHFEVVMPLLLDAQQRRDLLYLADLLQYEIGPLVSAEGNH